MKLNYKLTKRGKNFFIKNIEEKTILLIFAKVKAQEALTLGDQLVLDSFKRYSSQITNEDELREYLSGLSDKQLEGVASNVKGILHEIEFVAKENNDFDSVRAALYENTSHPGYDIIMTNTNTGEVWESQLKATDNAAYVEEWQSDHDGELLITDELAEKMGIASSGFSNEELSQRVDQFIDNSIEQGSNFNTSIFEYFPHITSLAIGLMIWKLYQRKQNGEITPKQFESLVIKHTGQKVVKVAGLMALLSIPGINIATVGFLLYRFTKDLNKSGLLGKLKNLSNKYYHKYKPT